MAGSTGKKHSRVKKCSLHDRCYVFEAIRLHDAYVDALKKYDSIQKKYAEELNAARFVRDVARSVANSEEKLKPRITENISPGSKGYVEIELKDKSNNGVSGEKYELYIPGEAAKSGVLGGDGTAKVDGIKYGPCFVEFPGRDDDIWEKFLSPQRSKIESTTQVKPGMGGGMVRSYDKTVAITARNYKGTHLNAYIQFREKKVLESEQAAEQAAKALVRYISSARFQKHLVNQHGGMKETKGSKSKGLKFIPDSLVKSFYEVDADGERKKKKLYREIDHYLALLTEDLCKTREGLKYLDTLFDEEKLKKQVGFADVWGYVGKARTVSEATGKFLYNAIPAVVLKINQKVDWRKVKDLNDIANYSGVDSYFSFLTKKMPHSKFIDWLDARVDFFAKQNSRLARSARNKVQFEAMMTSMIDPNSRSYDAEYANSSKKFDAEAALDGAWFGLMLDSVAAVCSTYAVFSAMDKAPLKDKLAMVNDMLGLLKTVMETVENKYKFHLAVEVEKNASDDVVRMMTTKASSAKVCVRVLTGLAVIVTAAIAICEIYDAFGKRNWRVIALNVASLGAMLIGLCYSGIGAVLAVILAVIAYLVYEPPVIDFLQLSYWGEDYIGASKSNRIPVKDTISKYFEMVYTLKVYFRENTDDRNESYIVIQSGMLTDGMPVYIQVYTLVNKKWKALDKWKKVYPDKKDVDGKGRVIKNELSWIGGTPYPKEMMIFYPWKIWPAIERDGNTEYSIYVATDPSRNKKYSLRANTKGVEFPSPEDPKFNMRGKNIFSDSAAVIDHGDCYFALPDHFVMELNIHTKYAKGCTFKVKITNLSAFPDRVVFDSGRESHKIEGNHTKLSVPINRQKDDPFEIRTNIYLFGPDGKQVDKALIPGIGADHYIASKEQIRKLKGK